MERKRPCFLLLHGHRQNSEMGRAGQGGKDAGSLDGEFMPLTSGWGTAVS